MQKILALLLALTLCCFAGCGGQTAEPEATAPTEPEEKTLIGILLPDDSWKEKGAALDKALQEKGYATKLLYAQNDPVTQMSQIEQLQAQDAQCMILAAEDAMALASVLETVQVPVIAYDRLLTDTERVDVFVGFDYEAMGQQIGRYIREEKALQDAALEGDSYTIEFFMGAAEDNSARLFHKGVLSVLQPYLDSGVLVCNSGRTTFADTYVNNGLSERKCEDILLKDYTDAPPDIICAGSDLLARGCVKALEKQTYEDAPWPLITGQGGDEDSVTADRLAVTVKKDYDRLAEACAKTADALLKGKKPNYNGKVDNYVIEVPAVTVAVSLAEADA